MEQWRVLYGACLSSVRTPDDFDYDEGVMPARPFRELLGALTADQLEALVWVALADLAVWPQFPRPVRDELLQASRVPGGTPSDRSDPDAASLVALQHWVKFSHAVRAASGSAASQEPLRAAVEHVAQASGRPGAYWEDWLLRVIPCAARTPVATAHAFAVQALECQQTAPTMFAYEATLHESGLPYVHVVTPRMGGKKVATLGAFEDYVPQARVIRARFVPSVGAEPVDPYRMGYWFRTTLMSVFFQDHYEGRYDEVVITHATTGATFLYEPP